MWPASHAIFGGGGHKAAAGLTYHKSLADALIEVPTDVIETCFPEDAEAEVECLCILIRSLRKSLMTKRGSSGLSLLLAIDKPKGMTSHDVVNRVRRVFGEKRVKYMGTLDPLASGVLCVAVGPATRLDAFMSGHNKTYVMDIAFGCATTTG